MEVALKLIYWYYQVICLEYQIRKPDLVLGLFRICDSRRPYKLSEFLAQTVTFWRTLFSGFSWFHYPKSIANFLDKTGSVRKLLLAIYCWVFFLYQDRDRFWKSYLVKIIQALVFINKNRTNNISNSSCSSNPTSKHLPLKRENHGDVKCPVLPSRVVSAYQGKAKYGEKLLR